MWISFNIIFLREGKNHGKTELPVSGKTLCPRHSWLEDVILLGLTSGNSTYAASSHPWSTFRRLGNYCVLSLVLTTLDVTILQNSRRIWVCSLQVLNADIFRHGKFS